MNWRDEIVSLDHLGYARLPSLVSEEQVQRLLQVCQQKFDQHAVAGVARTSRGHVYAARNVIDAAPEIHPVWRNGGIREFLLEGIGSHCGLVRGLYFDKPPERSWALPWHKDQSIAVRNNDRTSSHFSRPTTKLGVPHVIASEQVLNRMLTLRIHLDEVTEENGALRVIPRSHLASEWDQRNEDSFDTIYAMAGDVLAMKPLIVHSSGSSHPDTVRHRRILHLEFAVDSTLPDGYEWHQFVPI